MFFYVNRSGNLSTWSIGLLLAASHLLSSCASTQRQAAEGSSRAATASDVEVIPKSGSQSIDDMIAAVEPKVEKQSPEEDKEDVGDEITQGKTKGIPLEMNEQVEFWINYFTVKDRERFRRFLERGEKYKPMVTAVLKEQGIPTEIYYQAMIESGFATAARSHANAVGIWQFIRGTGKRYGLHIDYYVDERRDPMRATIAAALYLRDLHRVFQSWYLAMAAYNAGEGRILGAIMRGKSRDFWELVNAKVLPSETMQYIPKFLAAAHIGHNLEKYGFDDIKSQSMPTLASVSVPSSVQLSDIARHSELSLSELKSYNPHLLRNMTPPGKKDYRVWVPKTLIAAIEKKYDTFAKLKVKNLRVASHGDTRYHKVKNGENLTLIARKYGTSVASIKRLNGLRTTVIQRGQVLKVNSAGPKRYVVRRGDSLGHIARKFRTTVSRIKQANNLKRNTIYVGQVLNL